MNRNDHPAWVIYNLFRTSKLNEKYYSHKIKAYDTWNTIFEITIAFTAPGGTISALWFWSSPIGSYIWKIFLVIAAIVSLVKPFFKLTDKIKNIQECLSGYRVLTFDLKEMINDMIEKQKYDQEIKNRYKEATKRVRELILKSPEDKPCRKLIRRYTNEVNTELENFNFYIPEENDV